MADITGARGTLNIEQAQREIDMSKTIALLEPNLNPLQVLTRQLDARPTGSPKFSWMEDEGEARFDEFAAVATNVAVNVTVADGTKFAEHYVIQNTATQENMLVTGVAGNVLTVERGKGGAASAIAIGNEILIIGVHQPEGDSSRPARSSNPNQVFNYTGITRTPFESTGTLLASDFTHNPADWPFQARKAGIEHGKDLEYQKLFGKKFEDNTGSQPRRGTGGVLSFINTNQTNAGGNLTKQEFNIAMRAQGRYSGYKSKLGLGSPIAVSELNDFPGDNMQWEQSSRTFGVNIGQFITPHGVLNLVNHWLLEGDRYGGYLVILDMDEVKRRVLKGRDTHVRTNIQNADVDGRKDEYLTEDGLELGQERKHALIDGITDAA